MIHLPALSILQPWAWCCAEGFKPVENRGERGVSLGFRGPFLIHAGKGFDDDFNFAWASKLIGRAFPPKSFFDGQRGGIVGMAEVVDVVRAHDSPWFFGPVGLILKNARPLAFHAFRGQLGFFPASHPGVTLPDKNQGVLL